MPSAAPDSAFAVGDAGFGPLSAAACPEPIGLACPTSGFVLVSRDGGRAWRTAYRGPAPLLHVQAWPSGAAVARQAAQRAPHRLAESHRRPPPATLPALPGRRPPPSGGRPGHERPAAPQGATLRGGSGWAARWGRGGARPG